MDQYISEEVAHGKLIPASEAHLLHSVHTSPIGIIPKSNQPGKFRLIVDLSSPTGFSVNDRINPDLCSLEYASLDQAVSMAVTLGQGSLLAKLDLKSAYRMVPVSPQDQHLLGLEWRGTVFCDQALPFGLRSAPIIFTAVADGLAWALHCSGLHSFIHYLDDFLFCGPPASQICAGALEVAVPLCARLGLPVAPSKVEGPSTTITFLGIEIDTVRQVLRLPQAKLSRLQEALREWTERSSATKRQLQSIIGQLNHATAVVRPGRTFIRHLIETMKLPRMASHRVRLNSQCKSDLVWWSLFLQDWNGIAFFPIRLKGNTAFSDASGSWGCAAFEQESLDWFQICWPQSGYQASIAVMELLRIVVSAAIWGHRWRGTQVTFQCDNLSVVQALSSRSARDPGLMHLLRCLFFFEAFFQFEHMACHIPGRANSAADALSRDSFHGFLSLFPQAASSPHPVPQELCELLTDSSLTWTSQRWKTLFSTILRRVLPRVH